MGQVLHGSATTTEAVRRAIQHSQGSLRGLAKRYGIRLLEHLMQERHWPAVHTTCQAKKAEERRAESLRKRGYAVYAK